MKNPARWPGLLAMKKLPATAEEISLRAGSRRLFVPRHSSTCRAGRMDSNDREKLKTLF